MSWHCTVGLALASAATDGLRFGKRCPNDARMERYERTGL